MADRTFNPYHHTHSLTQASHTRSNKLDSWIAHQHTQHSARSLSASPSPCSSYSSYRCRLVRSAQHSFARTDLFFRTAPLHQTPLSATLLDDSSSTCERRSAEHLRTALHCIHDCIPVRSIHSALLKVLLSITRPATLSLFNAVIRPRSNHSVHLVPALRPSFCATSRSLCCSYLCNEFHLHTSWRPPTGSHPAVVTSSQS